MRNNDKNKRRNAASDRDVKNPNKSLRPKSANKPQAKPQSKTKPPRKAKTDKPATQIAATMRIAKAIARAGLCSRREAETWVEQGRISVNGEVLTSPALNVTPQDVILIDGESMPGHQQTRLYRYHKPKGQVTTHKDPDGRQTVFENLPDDLPRLISVGRLDLNTEGLLLLTNDGALARLIELPKTGWLRRYKVRAHGRVRQAQLDRLKQGITIDGIKYGAIEAELERQQASNVWLKIGIREGKNREIRKVLAELDLKVNRLIRLSFGPFQLGDLKMGAVDEVNIQTLRDQLGEKTSTELGLQPAPSKAQNRPTTKSATDTVDNLWPGNSKPKKPQVNRLLPKKKVQKRRNTP